jgi:hypothetical protein
LLETGFAATALIHKKIPKFGTAFLGLDPRQHLRSLWQKCRREDGTQGEFHARTRIFLAREATHTWPQKAHLAQFDLLRLQLGEALVRGIIAPRLYIQVIPGKRM